MAAKDIEYAEKAAHGAKESVEKLNKKTGEVLAEGIDLAQTAKHRSDAVSKVRKTNWDMIICRTKVPKLKVNNVDLMTAYKKVYTYSSI